MRRQPDEVDEVVMEYGKIVSWKSTGHRPNLRKRWLKANRKGSPARLAWEGRKELRERFRFLIENTD